MRVALDNVSTGLSTSPQTIGGMRMYFTNLVETLLHHTDHQILLLSPKWFESPFPTDLARLTDIRLAGVPVHRSARVLYEQFRYHAEIEAARPDVYIGLCNSIPHGLPIPSAVFVKSLQYLYTPEAFDFVRRTYLQWVVRLTARQANVLIVPTQTTGKDLERVAGVSSEKIRVVPEALYIRNSNILELDKGSGLRESIARLTGNRPFILCVGATYPYKNLERLIFAFARLKSQLRSPLVLLLIGAEGGVTYTSLRQLAQNAGVGESVICAGRRPYDEIVAAYNLAELMVMPTLYETFGHPVLEAMACGCPVVTSNFGAVAEVAGLSAELVDPFDVESIATGMQRVLTDESRQAFLKQTGRDRSAQFSWRSVALQINEILMELCS
jgi:glycosyltransferase involved in cell wall biosynthesis